MNSGRRCGSVIFSVQNRILTPDIVARALLRKGEDRLGDYLMKIGALTEEQLYEALAVQQQIPLVRTAPPLIPRKIALALPRYFIVDWKVISFSIDEQGMHLCTPEPPSIPSIAALERTTRLAIRFHLIPASRFAALSAEVLDAKRPKAFSHAAGN